MDKEKKVSPYGDEFTDDMLPPEPKRWPTAEELRGARLEELDLGVKGGIRPTQEIKLIVGGRHAFRRKGPRIK